MKMEIFFFTAAHRNELNDWKSTFSFEELQGNSFPWEQKTKGGVRKTIQMIEEEYNFFEE